MRKIPALVAVGCMMVVGATAATAQDPPPNPELAGPAEAPLDALDAAYRAVLAGEWLIVAGAALSLAVLAVRHFGLRGFSLLGWKVPPLLPEWFGTDRGGVALLFLGNAFGMVAHGLMAGETPSLDSLVAALKVGLVAIGGYAGLRKLLQPSDAPAPPAPRPEPPSDGVRPVRLARARLPVDHRGLGGVPGPA